MLMHVCGSRVVAGIVHTGSTVDAGQRQALVRLDLARGAREPHRACAAIAADVILARASIDTRLTRAVVDVGLAGHTCPDPRREEKSVRDGT